MAFNDPKELKNLDPATKAIKRVVAALDEGELPAMLRIPKKRPKAETNGG